MTWSPHLYLLEGRKRGVDEAVMHRALERHAALAKSGLPTVLTLRHLATSTGSSYGFLRAVVSRNVDPYYAFKVSKRRGGFRQIHSPAPQLRSVQRWISDKILRV